MQYYLLAASKHKSRLYEVTDDTIKEHPIEGMPSGIDDAFQGMERHDKTLQSHSGGGGTAIFHGQGGAKDVQEQEEDEYYRQLASSLHTFLHNQAAPLIFAGVEEAFGMFRSFDSSHRLIDQFIHGSPDRMSPDELKQKADPIVSEYLLKKNEPLLEEYGNLLGTGRTSDDVEAILESAKNGKVDLLLVAEGKQLDAQSPIGELVSHTMQHHGRVALIKADRMPNGAEVAAILRL